MRISERAVMLLSAAGVMVLALGTVPVGTYQAPKPPAPQEKAKKAPAPIQGELVKVDTTAKTITVAAADGKDVLFRYTDATVVTGAKEGVAGLATMTKSQVTVHFTEEGQTRTATRIEVRPNQ